MYWAVLQWNLTSILMSWRNFCMFDATNEHLMPSWLHVVIADTRPVVSHPRCEVTVPSPRNGWWPLRSMLVIVIAIRWSRVWNLVIKLTLMFFPLHSFCMGRRCTCFDYHCQGCRQNMSNWPAAQFWKLLDCWCLAVVQRFFFLERRDLEGKAWTASRGLVGLEVVIGGGTGNFRTWWKKMHALQAASAPITNCSVLSWATKNKMCMTLRNRPRRVRHCAIRFAYFVTRSWKDHGSEHFLWAALFRSFFNAVGGDSV